MKRPIQVHDPLASRRAALRLVVSPAPPAAHKAPPVKLLASDSAEDAAVCIFSSALDHFEANIPPLRAGEGAEAVHQMRVALRRLRAAIGLFSEALSGPALDAARERAKNLASILGAARNWDVFCEMLEGGPSDALANEPGFYALLDAVELRRAIGHRAAREEIDDERTEVFVAQFRKAIANRDWTAAPRAQDEKSAKDFARSALTRLRKRVLKKSKGLARLTAEERHEARIALKKARYGAEFFQSLFQDRKEAEAYSASLAKMQDGLGVFNDMETANALLDEIDTEGGATLRASGFVRGWFAHAAQAGTTHARKSEKRLKKLEPFWA